MATGTAFHLVNTVRILVFLVLPMVELFFVAALLCIGNIPYIASKGEPWTVSAYMYLVRNRISNNFRILVSVKPSCSGPRI